VTVSLTKGGNLLLADEAPGIAEVRVGIGWADAPGSAGVEIDGIVVLTEGAPPGHLLLAHAVPNPEEPVTARPVTGAPVGDAERLVVRLAAVPAQISRLTFGAAIYDAAARRQTFRSVRDAYVRVLNHANGVEIARYTLDVETGSETAMVFGELYRHTRGWKFRAVGQGYASGLRGVAGDADPVAARPVDVTDYLRRISPVRSRRSLNDHLHPPAPAAKSAPAPASKPATRPAPAPQPAARPSAPPSRGLAPPPAPTPAARTPAPATKSRSSLDLSAPEPAETAPTRSTGGGASHSSSSRVEYGEHSSRHRQREEHVDTLDDDHPATTWTAAKRGHGGMTVTLRWEPLQTASGLPRPSDLHLGAFWQAGDRAEGLLQTLGNTISAPGAAGPRQVLRLGRRDEREGQAIFVDLASLPSFRRFFVYAYGQHGSPEWPQLRPELVVAAPSGESLAMRYGDAPSGTRLCVVASFHVVDDDLVIRRENDYVEGLHADAAARYGWSMEWNPDGMTVRASGRATT
jgi:stress response protein SCP2/uncharacterized protein involved in tellurium resistance